MQQRGIRSHCVRHGLALAAGALALAPARAQPAPAASEAPCPPARPVPPALAGLVDRMLAPGQTLGLGDLTPEARQELAAFQREAAARQAADWPALCRYAEANAALRRGGERPRVVFIGDSITEYWERGDPALFGAATLDRGISGQTTPQILLRFYPDVINLRPRIVHIMAGTNDIAGNTGPTTDQAIVDNLRAMIVLAQAAGIRVVLGAITPSAGFASRPGFNPAARIVRVNGLLRRLAGEQRVAFVDYHAALADAAGGLRAGLANDGLHPNRNGYAAMRPLTERALAAAARGR